MFLNDLALGKHGVVGGSLGRLRPHDDQGIADEKVKVVGPSHFVHDAAGVCDRRALSKLVGRSDSGDGRVDAGVAEACERALSGSVGLDVHAELLGQLHDRDMSGPPAKSMSTDFIGPFVSWSVGSLCDCISLSSAIPAHEVAAVQPCHQKRRRGGPPRQFSVVRPPEMHVGWS